MSHAASPSLTGDEPERWLRGPVDGIDPLLQPLAHALLQARDDVQRVTRGVSAARLWSSPGGAAPAGFHLRHMAGSLDRLFTYARGEALTEAQRAYLAEESMAGVPPLGADALARIAADTIDRALAQLAATEPASLLDVRYVGGKRLPSNVLGVLFHAAEHTTRHVGQLITTLRVYPDAE